jgi:hypothetical protein
VKGLQQVAREALNRTVPLCSAKIASQKRRFIVFATSMLIAAAPILAPAAAWPALASDGVGVSLGQGALANNTVGVGIDNTAVEFYALIANTSGSHNTTLGYNALITNTGGYSNIASGQYALVQPDTGLQHRLWSKSTLTGLNQRPIAPRRNFTPLGLKAN